MAQRPLEQIGDLLARIGTPGAFASSRSAKAEDLHIEVYGVGRLRFPLTAAAARRLCGIARPAQHGYKDQTRLDRRVRDCWEIPAELISIDPSRWNRTLIPQLDHLRRDLGLPHACRLHAELHNLLIYGPGQFFVPHQDSEKSDAMIGTLVVGLPSSFTGGTFVVEHHGETRSFGGSAERLSLIAFYADCHHQVKPVKSGYRVVLTYNLIAEGAVPAPAGPSAATTALADALRRFFDTPVPPRWSGDREPGPPDRLVYLLDHQYTQRGLAWTRLKGADAERAAALRDAARQLDCECFLALADVHETWSCVDAYGASGHRRRWDDGDEDEDDADADESGADLELTDLLDSAVELRHWVGPGERPREIASLVADGELCYTRPSVEFEPFESEHEGYMGNWGNTVDHWYHRAAVVLWPRERSFVVRAKASASWAMAEIAKTLRKDGAAAAQALARRVLPFWSEAVRRDSGKTLLAATLKAAAALDDATLAAALLKPFALTGLGPKSAPLLAALLVRYGPAWCAALFDQWSPQYKPHEPTEARRSWIAATLPQLCRGLCAQHAVDAATTLAQRIAGQQWAWTAACINEIRRHARPRDLPGFLQPFCVPLLALIESSRITDQPELHARLIDAASDDDLSLVLLQQAHGAYPPAVRRSLGLGPVHARCTQAFTQRLEAPVRADGDWSIATPLSCPRALGPTLMPFLRDATRTRLEWPLAEAGRAQVHRLIDDHDLPVVHTTRRSGRPYTLVLEKTRALFERAAADRRSWQAALQWLAQTAADF